MRILFVHSGADLYGASRSLLRLGSMLYSEGHQVIVVLPHAGPLVEELEKAGVGVEIHLNLPVVTREGFKRRGGVFGLAWQLLGSLKRLEGVMWSFNTDLVHSNTALILSSGIIARVFGIPHIWHVREFFDEFPKLWRWYQWYMHWFADQIVCVSSSVASQFHRDVRNKKVIVIHNGFPREEFGSVGSDRIAAFKQSYGVNGYVLVGVVGRIKFGRKGQDVFVKAAALLKDRFPEARFLLIGSPFPGNEEHLKNLRVLISELGIEQSVVYTGDVEDIKAAYAALDISVLPSARPEPFGGVVIESMAFGKPVIGTRIGGTIEQIDDARTGLLIEPNDPQALADAIEKLLKDPQGRMAMGKLGYERFMSHFEFEEFFGKIMQLYTQQAHLGGVR